MNLQKIRMCGPLLNISCESKPRSTLDQEANWVPPTLRDFERGAGVGSVPPGLAKVLGDAVPSPPPNAAAPPPTVPQMTVGIDVVSNWPQPDPTLGGFANCTGVSSTCAGSLLGGWVNSTLYGPPAAAGQMDWDAVGAAGRRCDIRHGAAVLPASTAEQHERVGSHRCAPVLSPCRVREGPGVPRQDEHVRGPFARELTHKQNLRSQRRNGPISLLPAPQGVAVDGAVAGVRCCLSQRRGAGRDTERAAAAEVLTRGRLWMEAKRR